MLDPEVFPKVKNGRNLKNERVNTRDTSGKPRSESNTSRTRAMTYEEGEKICTHGGNYTSHKNDKNGKCVRNLDRKERCWSVTINNFTDNEEEIFKTYVCTRKRYSVEKGEESGIIHIQGCVYIEDKIKGWKLKDVFPNAHLEVALEPKWIEDYCSKEHTRIRGPYLFGPERAQGKKNNTIKGNSNHRTIDPIIYWIYGDGDLYEKAKLLSINKSIYVQDTACKYWDHYKNESNIIIRDLSLIDDLVGMFSNMPFYVPIKGGYGSKIFNTPRIFILGNKDSPYPIWKKLPCVTCDWILIEVNKSETLDPEVTDPEVTGSNVLEIDYSFKRLKNDEDLKGDKISLYTRTLRKH